MCINVPIKSQHKLEVALQECAATQVGALLLLYNITWRLTARYVGLQLGHPSRCRRIRPQLGRRTLRRSQSLGHRQWQRGMNGIWRLFFIMLLQVLNECSPNNLGTPIQTAMHHWDCSAGKFMLYIYNGIINLYTIWYNIRLIICKIPFHNISI